MNVGYAMLLHATLLSAGLASALPDTVIRDRARGYATMPLGEVAAIEFKDGVSADEALALAKWRIYGAVDARDLPVLSYGSVECAGAEWKVDVVLMSPEGSVHRPIFTDKITGLSHGPGWSNFALARIVVGDSWFRYERTGETISLRVTHNRFTEADDLDAKQQLITDALAAAELARTHFPSRFRTITRDDLHVAQRRWHGVVPDHQWIASAKLSRD